MNFKATCTMRLARAPVMFQKLLDTRFLWNWLKVVEFVALKNSKRNWSSESSPANHGVLKDLNKLLSSTQKEASVK